MSKLAVMLLAGSLLVNGIQYLGAENLREQYDTMIETVHGWEYDPTLVKQRQTGNLWLTIKTPAGRQIHEFAGVCPKELTL